MTDPPGRAPMDPELQLLLEIQDLRAQRRELAEERGGRMEAETFRIDLEAARAQLDRRVEELVESLSPTVRARYRRVAPQRDRVVVPVIGGVCYGCFVSIPTATAGDQAVHTRIRTCQSCGCFIYVTS